MAFTIRTVEEKKVTDIRIEAAVNYDEEEIPNDFPGRRGDMWRAVINLYTHKIEGWPKGRVEKMHLTVKDCGTYSLHDVTGRVISTIEDNYVPNGVIPGSHGDTIELEIDGDGTVTNWPDIPLLEAFDKLE